MKKEFHDKFPDGITLEFILRLHLNLCKSFTDPNYAREVVELVRFQVDVQDAIEGVFPIGELWKNWKIMVVKLKHY